MPTWVIQTGGESWTATGRNCFDAASKAWKARPPKSVGVLVQFTPDGRESETRYSLGDVALRKAGFDCPEVSVEEYTAAMERPGSEG